MTNASTRYADGAELPGESLPLSAEHRRELFLDSVIDPDVARERGYETIERVRLDAFGRDSRAQMAALGFPSWAIREPYHFPGLHIPQFTPAGTRYAGQFKPRNAVPDRNGKRVRYASAKGPSRLDVHPRWTGDRGTEDAALVPVIQDPTIRLWITEGVKKADSLTSRGECTVALAGVYSWRNTHASLGDWEDVRLKGREIVLCFDTDAVTKPHVAQAMGRLGKWLRHRGARKVWYLVVPPGVNDIATKGVDDFFAAGGTLKQLEQAFETRPPEVPDSEDRFTDARLAETMAAEILDGCYIWAAGLDWLTWDGRVWREVHEVTVMETVRQWALTKFTEAAKAFARDDKAAAAEMDGWRGLLSANRARTVLSLARGIVERRSEEFDSDPDILNTPSGIVNLANGELLLHDPDTLCTKITSGSYRQGYRHPDWERALKVLPFETMNWIQVMAGQAATGHIVPDGIMPVLKGGGENGKGLLFTEGIVPACGGYAGVASPKLFEKGQHSTEQADLRGLRIVVAEELAEGRSIDVSAMKRIVDVGRVKARKTHRDNVEFDATHTLFGTTNYTPTISETDWGTWRRLLLVVFPFTFIKPGMPILDPEWERRGDPTLKARIKMGKDGQHDAIVTWIVEGALRWYRNMAETEKAVANGEEAPPSILLPPVDVRADTLAWRIEADRVLGYWHECLVADPTAYVLAAELTEHFNEWLRIGGHNPWPKELFGPRFRDHTETKRQRVSATGKKRTATIAAHIARRPLVEGFGATHRALPAQADLLLGVRWRNETDPL